MNINDLIGSEELSRNLEKEILQSLTNRGYTFYYDKKAKYNHGVKTKCIMFYARNLESTETWEMLPNSKGSFNQDLSKSKERVFRFLIVKLLDKTNFKNPDWFKSYDQSLDSHYRLVDSKFPSTQTLWNNLKSKNKPNWAFFRIYSHLKSQPSYRQNPFENFAALFFDIGAIFHYHVIKPLKQSIRSLSLFS